MPSVLEQLPVDPRPDDFFDELWDELRVRESQRARRWRLIAAVATVVALAAIAAGVVAAVSRSTVLDRTLSCPVPVQGGVRTLYFGAEAIRPGGSFSNKPFPGSVSMLPYLEFDSAHSGYTLDHALCRRAPSLPLAPAGLPRVGVFTDQDYKGVGIQCSAPGRLVFRIRLTQDQDAVPTRARIAIRLGRLSVAYVDWSPHRETVYATSSPRCEIH